MPVGCDPVTQWPGKQICYEPSSAFWTGNGINRRYTIAKDSSPSDLFSRDSRRNDFRGRKVGPSVVHQVLSFFVALVSCWSVSQLVLPSVRKPICPCARPSVRRPVPTSVPSSIAPTVLPSVRPNISPICPSVCPPLVSFSFPFSH